MDPIKEVWEERLHRELKSLPDLKAPASLMRRVRSAVEVQARPWWRRMWWTWPAAGRSALIAALALGASLIIASGWKTLGAAPWREARFELGWWGELPMTLARAIGLAAWSLRAPLFILAGTMSLLGTGFAAALMAALPQPRRGKAI